ncbi:MAG TPA: arsenate reductase (glutaredoxin) [Steroidobacteraceae bacterium]|nr:arsenate reductase (glutaredoxin) [Steroidobacteraceae bacterium]
MAQTADEVVIYHNPRCTKSRAALELIRARGVEPRVVEYLRTPLDARAIEALLRRLALPASALVRRKEQIFRDRFADRTLDEDEWLTALAEHPELLERPIVTRGERAVLARPPERVLDLFA